MPVPYTYAFIHNQLLNRIMHNADAHPLLDGQVTNQKMIKLVFLAHALYARFHNHERLTATPFIKAKYGPLPVDTAHPHVIAHYFDLRQLAHFLPDSDQVQDLAHDEVTSAILDTVADLNQHSTMDLEYDLLASLPHYQATGTNDPLDPVAVADDLTDWELVDDDELDFLN